MPGGGAELQGVFVGGVGGVRVAGEQQERGDEQRMLPARVGEPDPFDDRLHLGGRRLRPGEAASLQAGPHPEELGPGPLDGVARAVRQHRHVLDVAAALCSHLLGEGSVHAFLAEHRHRLFPDEMFSDLFPTNRGRPSVPADVVATVMVLQALEGRSDREACRALQTDIAWKAAAGLALTDEAFHPTVLTLWRNKLRASKAPQRIFDAVRSVIIESGVIAT